jgi:hypothetical protein
MHDYGKAKGEFGVSADAHNPQRPKRFVSTLQGPAGTKFA